MDVVNAHINGKLSTKDYTTYIGKVIANEDKNVQTALKYAQKELNIDDVGIIYNVSGAQVTTKQKQIYNVIHNDLTDQYIAIKTMSTKDRIASQLTDTNGNFDALSYIQGKIKVLVKDQEINIDKQSFNKVKSLIQDLYSGRIISQDRGKFFSEKTDFSQFSQKEFQEILATFSERPKNKMSVKVHRRNVTLLTRLIEEAE